MPFITLGRAKELYIIKAHTGRYYNKGDWSSYEAEYFDDYLDAENICINQYRKASHVEPPTIIVYAVQEQRVINISDYIEKQAKIRQEIEDLEKQKENIDKKLKVARKALNGQ